MRRVYFDITDLVAYAQHSSRVSGIQRVQWNIITYLARQFGGDLIRVSFHDWRTDRMLECSATEALVGEEFDAELVLIKFGVIKYRRFLPSHVNFRAYLRRRSRNTLVRVFLKAEVYFASFLLPHRLTSMGLERMKRRPGGVRRAPLRHLLALDKSESFVLLGPHWHFPAVLEFAHRHKQGGGDVVALIYDLIPHKFPQFANTGVAEMFTRWLGDLARSATRFMCISKATAQDLRQFLDGQYGQWLVAAVPLAHEFHHYERFTPVRPLTQRVAEILRESYVLCVGTFEIRKNGATLLRAWLRLKQELGAQLPRLIFAGSKGWLMDDFITVLSTDTSIAHTIEKPTDEELAALYQNCLFTVYPSFYEGWGLPVGEAAWFGKFCVAANTSSMPEVLGDLIDYLDPYDLDDIVRKLRRALVDSTYVRSREAAIAAQTLRRWTDVADDMMRFILKQDVSPTVAVPATQAE